MRYKSFSHFEARLYIGSRAGYNGPTFDEEELVTEVGKYQSLHKDMTGPVRITKTQYIFDDYRENGWEITAIVYPRFPQPESIVRMFMLSLGGYLLERFKQNRISIAFPDEIVMLEADEAEQKHK